MRKYLTNTTNFAPYPAERKKKKETTMSSNLFPVLNPKGYSYECGCRHLRHLFCQVNHSIVVVYVWFLRTTNEASLPVTLVRLSVEFFTTLPTDSLRGGISPNGIGKYPLSTCGSMHPHQRRIVSVEGSVVLHRIGFRKDETRSFTPTNSEGR